MEITNKLGNINMDYIVNYVKYMSKASELTSDDCVFVMIDIQESFSSVIYDFDEVVKNSNILNKASEIFNIPVIITEQYPKGLGHTHQDIFIPEKATRLEKTKFSIFTDEFMTKIEEISTEKGKKPILVIYGIETHICVTQSILDALSNSFYVLLVADAVSSRKLYSKEIAIKMLESKGVEIVTTEMLLFRFLKNAKHTNFKEVSKLIK